MKAAASRLAPSWLAPGTEPRTRLGPGPCRTPGGSAARRVVVRVVRMVRVRGGSRFDGRVGSRRSQPEAALENKEHISISQPRNRWQWGGHSTPQSQHSHSIVIVIAQSQYSHSHSHSTVKGGSWGPTHEWAEQLQSGVSARQLTQPGWDRCLIRGRRSPVYWVEVDGWYGCTGGMVGMVVWVVRVIQVVRVEKCFVVISDCCCWSSILEDGAGGSAVYRPVQPPTTLRVDRPPPASPSSSCLVRHFGKSIRSNRGET